MNNVKNPLIAQAMGKKRRIYMYLSVCVFLSRCSLYTRSACKYALNMPDNKQLKTAPSLKHGRIEAKHEFIQ